MAIALQPMRNKINEPRQMFIASSAFNSSNSTITYTGMGTGRRIIDVQEGDVIYFELYLTPGANYTIKEFTSMTVEVID